MSRSFKYRQTLGRDITLIVWKFQTVITDVQVCNNILHNTNTQIIPAYTFTQLLVGAGS